MADRLSISKAELLDPSADNAAVRVALAESHVIAETKSFFEHVRILILRSRIDVLTVTTVPDRKSVV